MLLHAAHAAADGFNAVAVVAEDTDVFIMCLAFQNQYGVPLFQQCGKAGKRFIDIKKIAHAVGPGCLWG